MQKSSFDVRPRRLHALRSGLRQVDGGEPVLAFIEKTLVHPGHPVDSSVNEESGQSSNKRTKFIEDRWSVKYALIPFIP